MPCRGAQRKIKEVKVMALPHTTDILKYPARFQFGEATAPCGGASCCTDCCIKMIVEYYKEQTHSLAEIRHRAQSAYNFDERSCTGLNYLEVLAALNSFGIGHYKVSFGSDAVDVWNKVLVGPVIVGVHYGTYPERRDKCDRFGMKAESGGKTDCPFNGTHAVLAIHRRYHTTHRDIFVRDPDHNSPSRPEKPIYDIITRMQLDKAMKNLPIYTPFKETYIIYPTKKKTFPL